MKIENRIYEFLEDDELVLIVRDLVGRGRGFGRETKKRRVLLQRSRRENHFTTHRLKPTTALCS